MRKMFLKKLREAFWAIAPVTLIIFLLLFVLPSATDDKIKLGLSALLLIVGMALFTLGADNSMQELGENIGATLSKSKKVWLIVLCSSFIGFIITFAEPDLMVLAKQVAASTIFYGRGMGVHERDSFLGISLQPEKEIILTLTPTKNKNKIMQAICEKAKLEQVGNGICFSLPVTNVRGMSSVDEN